MKKLLLISVIILMSFSLAACDSEIHDRMLIRGIGIDFEGGYYDISVRAENVIDSREELLTARGETVYDALTNLSLKSGSRQMYTDSYFIVFGNNVAKIGLEKSLDFFIRYFKAMPTEQIFFTEGKAADILNTKKNDKLIPSSVIKDLKESGNNSGKAVSLSLMELLSQTMSPSKTALMPIINSDGETISLNGAVVLKEYKPILRLKDYEISEILISKGLIKTASLVIEDKEYGNVSLEISKSKPNININSYPENINLSIEVTAYIASVSLASPMELTRISDLEKIAGEKLKNDIERVISKCYKNNADVLGIKYKLYKEKMDMSIKENEYDFRVNVNLSIKKTGQEDKPDK